MSYFINRSSHGPWYGNDRERALFNRGLLASGYKVLSSPSSGQLRHYGGIYMIDLMVEPFGLYRVRVELTPSSANVFVENLHSPRHVYANGALCMWHPRDNRERRWEPSDGLVQLLHLTKVHIFQEIRYKETGEWIGEEVSHT